MVLSTYATLLAAGLFFQSLYFVLWVLLLVVPAWIYFLKVYEERELEIRFGAPYLEYKARTAFLWPRRPKA
jgi:protein-S-isoprenylcysteine O-methyltransferase Ste14